jgi:hypothetical protein
MKKATPGPSLSRNKTVCPSKTRRLARWAKWPLRVVLLLGLIAAFAAEPIAAKPTAKGRAVSGTKTRLRPRLKAQIVLPADLREFEYQEPLLAGDLLSAGLWSAYVVLGLVWFRIPAQRGTPLAQKLALRVRRTERSGAKRAFWKGFGELRQAQMQPRLAGFRSLAREQAALVNSLRSSDDADFTNLNSKIRVFGEICG